MRTLSAILLLIFLSAVAAFAVQNTQPLTVRFLTWKGDYPVALLSVVIYFLGMLSGWSVVGFLRRSISDVAASDRSL